MMKQPLPRLSFLDAFGVLSEYGSFGKMEEMVEMENSS